MIGCLLIFIRLYLITGWTVDWNAGLDRWTGLIDWIVELNFELEMKFLCYMRECRMSKWYQVPHSLSKVCLVFEKSGNRPVPVVSTGLLSYSMDEDCNIQLAFTYTKGETEIFPCGKLAWPHYSRQLWTLHKQ